MEFIGKYRFLGVGLRLGAASCALGFAACTTDLSSEGLRVPPNCRSPWCHEVKATAYTHTEADSLQYGKLTAKGTQLRGSGRVRSAAADWSKFPVGTRFRIIGLRQVFEVDDYGSALVGKDVVDIYQTSRSRMNRWGAPRVGIEVLEWGSWEESLRIMKPRSRHWHVARMVASIESRMRPPAALPQMPVPSAPVIPGAPAGRPGPMLASRPYPATVDTENVIVRARPIEGWADAPANSPLDRARPISWAD